jgi:hypothetical protein
MPKEFKKGKNTIKADKINKKLDKIMDTVNGKSKSSVFFTVFKKRYPDVKSKDIAKFYDALSKKEKSEIDVSVQKNLGQKKYEYLTLTDIGHSSNSIFKFDSVYDWAKENEAFQLKHALKDFGEEKAKENFPEDSLYLLADWFKWIEVPSYSSKEELVYGTLISLEQYIIDAITEKNEDWLSKKIPHGYFKKHNEKMFQKIKDGDSAGLYTMAEQELRAGGKEEEYERIRKELNDLYNTFRKEIRENISHLTNYTFRVYTDDDSKMIIGGIDVAKKISFKTFLVNFRDNEQPDGIVENAIDHIFKIIHKKYLTKLK